MKLTHKKLVVTFVSAALVLACGLPFLSNLAAPKRDAYAKEGIQSTTLKAAGSIVDKGEVFLNDDIEYHISTTFNSANLSEKSGVVTVVDKLPQGLSAQQSSGAWASIVADSSYSEAKFAEEPTCNTQTNTITYKIAGIPANQAVVVSLHGKVTAVATDGGRKEYVNYADVTYAANTQTTNGVRHFSGTPADETVEHSVTYTWKSGSIVPSTAVLPEALNHSEGVSVRVAPDPAAIGYSFNGWKVTTPASGTTISNGSFTMPSSDVVIEGSWSEAPVVKYSISYAFKGQDAGKDSAADLPQGLPQIASASISAGTPVSIQKYPMTDAEIAAASDDEKAADPYANYYSDYKFTGYTYSGYTLTDLDKEIGEYTPSANVSVVGKWERREHTVTFAYNASAPSGSTTPSAITAKWGKSFSAAGSQIEHYKFNGWTFDTELTKNTDGTYVMPHQDVLATGSFTAMHQITVTDGTSDKDWALPGDTVSVTPTNPTNTVFNAWTLGDGTSDVSTLDSWAYTDAANPGKATFVMGNADVSLSASFSIPVKFKAVNGSFVDAGAEKTVNISAAKNGNVYSGTIAADDVPASTPSVGYDANSKSWSSDPSGASVDNSSATHEYTVSYSPLTSITITYSVVPGEDSRGSVALNTQNLNANQRIIARNANGDATQVQETIQPATEKPKGATASSKDGYEFVCWTAAINIPQDWDGTDFPWEEYEISHKPTFIPHYDDWPGAYETLNYFVHFNELAYTVNFDPNGGSGEMQPQTIMMTQETELNKCTFALPGSGYSFVGWNTKPDGTGTFYGDGQTVSRLCANPEDEITLYAQWRESSQTDDTNKECISANDFLTTLDKINFDAGDTQGKLNEEDARKYSRVTAYSTEAATLGQAVDVTTITCTIDKSKCPGEFDCTFATAKGTSITVKVSVYNADDRAESGDALIYASNFSASVDDVKSKHLDDVEQGREALMKLAHVSAMDQATGMHVPQLVTIKSNIKPERGNYTVTFTCTLSDGSKATYVSNVNSYEGREQVNNLTAANDSVTKDITANITDHSAEDETNGERIWANDFDLTLGEVANLDDASVKKYAGAGAALIEGGGKVEIATVSYDALKAATEKGSYDVTFATAKGTSVTVKANVTADATDTAEGERLTAQNFEVGANDVAALTDEAILKLAGAKCVNLDTQALVDMKITKNDIVAAAGEYDVQISSTTDGGPSVTVKCTVFDGSQTIDPVNGEGIRANNFSIALEDIAALTDADAISRSSAHAWKLADETEAVSIATVDMSALKAATTHGAYDVVFSTAAGTSVRVKAVVYDKVIENDDEKIWANNFSVSLSEIQNLTDEQVIAYAHAGASKVADDTFVAVTPSCDSLKAANAAGNYTVTFSTESGTTLSVVATVKDAAADVVNPDTGLTERILANNFTINTDEVTSFSDAQICNRAGVECFVVETTEALTPSVNRSNLKAVPGRYMVSFMSPSGAKVDVFANVVAGPNYNPNGSGDDSGNGGAGDTIVPENDKNIIPGTGDTTFLSWLL